HERLGSEPAHPVRLNPRSGGPRERRHRERRSAQQGVRMAPFRDRVRDVRVGPEERERCEPAQGDRGGQALSKAKGARRHESQERARADDDPGDDEQRRGDQEVSGRAGHHEPGAHDEGRYARPTATYATAGIAPAPMPWIDRAATSTIMLGASPPARSPSAKSVSPATNGRAGPLRSASRPAATTPKRLLRKNALNT